MSERTVQVVTKTDTEIEDSSDGLECVWDWLERYSLWMLNLGV